MNSINETFTPLIERLRTRAKIRREITTRKSVQEGKPDKIADLLEEAADEIEACHKEYLEAFKVVEVLENELRNAYR